MRAALDLRFDVASLAREWASLYARSDENIFLSPAWITTWLGVAPAEVAIHALRVFDDLSGLHALALVGVPPRRSLLHPREARFLETGDEQLDRIYVEFSDLLVASNAPDGARESALDCLFDALDHIDEFVFRNVRPAFADAIRRAASARRFLVRTLLTQPTFEMRLAEAPGGDVFAGFSASLRAKIKRSIRRYEERGAVALEPALDASERAVAWTELARLHAETWAQRGEPGVFKNPELVRFHDRLIERHPGVVDLLRLTAGDETIGVLYNFRSATRAYNYQSGFRYEADNQLTPGLMAHALAAAHYRSEGLAAYDLMAGDADYKRRLGVETETLTSLVVERASWRIALRNVAKKIRPAAS